MRTIYEQDYADLYLAVYRKMEVFLQDSKHLETFVKMKETGIMQFSYL